MTHTCSSAGHAYGLLILSHAIQTILYPIRQLLTTLTHSFCSCCQYDYYYCCCWHFQCGCITYSIFDRHKFIPFSSLYSLSLALISLRFTRFWHLALTHGHGYFNLNATLFTTVSMLLSLNDLLYIVLCASTAFDSVDISATPSCWTQYSSYMCNK